MATLTTGVSWLVAGPALGADYCADRVAALRAPTTVASVCEELLDLRMSGNYGDKMTAPKDSDLAMSAETLARKAGLPGLSKASAVLSLADLGGVAAAAGAPSMPTGSPGVSGLRSVLDVPTAPDLPGLPNTPAIPGTLAALPPVPVEGEVPALPDASGLVAGVEAPIALPQPAETVTDEITGKLPETPDKALEAVPVPESEPVTGGIADLLNGLRLS
ncbi:hypothetical protein ACIBKY_35970 [Nonomuraea sp. NPDC050394]|uniref:hypothetical protein n=1 Tax=Nonomuraea sp. NPDC050394 TaxID=3364363 RepID=UPI0037896031